MPTVHTVEQGECLASIAARFGWSDWRPIYQHPQNASFRQLRPNPNVIFPGDQLYVPDPDLKNETGATEKQHNYQLVAEPTLLRLVLEDEDGQPFAYQKYELQVGDQLYNGSTDGTGLLEQPILPTDSTGRLVIWKQQAGMPPKGITWMLEIGALDPVEEITGVQARLNNLGYNSGPVDGIQGPITTAAVKDFQGEHELKVDGIVGPKTRGKLKSVYGC
jgi:N-acetylmuramoyl-L-alanine amidase